MKHTQVLVELAYDEDEDDEDDDDEDEFIWLHI